MGVQGACYCGLLFILHQKQTLAASPGNTKRHGNDRDILVPAFRGYHGVICLLTDVGDSENVGVLVLVNF